MKRFVLPKLLPSYVLLAIGALIYLLMGSGSTLAHLVAYGLFAVGVWIVFRPQKLITGARTVSTALLGAGRSRDSR